MAAGVDIILIFNSVFGSKGTGNDNFDLPSGMCLANNFLYIVDKQNHKVKKHSLNGTFVSSFGTVGAGNDNFFFPESITSDGTHLYITDSGNHRVKKHDLDGIFVAEFGTHGSGNDNFDYPMQISMMGTDLLIADKQNNRIKKHSNAGVFQLEVTGFLFPEGVAYDIANNEIVVADSANKKVLFYTSTGDYLRDSNAIFSYPTQIRITNGVITVLDKQASRLVFLTETGLFIRYFGVEGTSQTELLFPTDVVYDDDTLYILDSANYRVVNYNFIIAADVPVFSDVFLRLTKRLYPTGRAWWMKINGIFEKFHLGLAYSESRARSILEDLLNSIIPDNDFFSTTDASNWEKALGLYDQAGLDLTTRKTAILRKMRFPGETISRQHFKFLEGELQAAGFNVIVTENRFGTPPEVVSFNGAIYDAFAYGDLTYGQQALDAGDAEILANYIDAAKDATFNFGGAHNLRATWFVSADPYPNIAAIDIRRKNEFRDLMLRLKPAQTAGFLFVKFVSFSGFTMDSTTITMDSTTITIDKT